MDDGARELEAFWQRANGLARALALAGAAALYVLMPNGRAAALGLLVGSVVSILRYQLRYRALTRGPGAGALVRLRLLSYAMSGAALALAFAFPQTFWPWTAAAGLLVMNASVIAAELLPSKRRGRAERAAGGA